MHYTPVVSLTNFFNSSCEIIPARLPQSSKIPIRGLAREQTHPTRTNYGEHKQILETLETPGKEQAEFIAENS